MNLKEVFVVYGVIIGVFVTISMTVSAFLWPYAINEWLLYVGKEPAMLWWHGAIIGILPPLGVFSIPLALVTFVLMMFLS